MARFADVAEFEEYLGRTLTTDEAYRADALLTQASAMIQNYTHQRIEFVDDDALTLYGNGEPTLFLPELPIVDVDDITVDGTLLTIDTDYQWSPSGRLTRVSTPLWGSRTKRSTIAITYSHGYQVIPDDIRRACVEMAADSLMRPTGGVQSVSADGYSATFKDEKTTEAYDLLDRYRLVTVA